MPIHVSTRFFVRCDHCVATVRTNPINRPPHTTAIQYFASPLAAIHHALEAHWSLSATSILCPTCSAAVDAERKEP